MFIIKIRSCSLTGMDLKTTARQTGSKTSGLRLHPTR